jgi:DNA-binding MarR family transcriptional regulator
MTLAPRPGRAPPPVGAGRLDRTVHGNAERSSLVTTDDPLDPLIHAPARLRIVVTLAALREGDALSFTRLQNMIGLTPGNLITHMRKLENAGYLSSDKTGNGTASRTSIALTQQGRAALGTYTTALRGLLDGV